MAIQNRRGNYTDFDPTKMVAGEFAVVQNGDPDGTDGEAVYFAPKAGKAKRLVTADDVRNVISGELEDIIAETEAELADDVQRAEDAADSVASSVTQIATNTADIADIKEDLRQKTGLSEEAKVALLDCFEHVAWLDEHGQTYYDNLYDALYPDTGLESITAVFTQGSLVVYPSTPLSDLKAYLVVTGYYKDGSSGRVTDYALTGTLTTGTSTITVTADGKTTTFDVAVDEPEPTIIADLTSDDLSYGRGNSTNNSTGSDYAYANTKRASYVKFDIPITPGKSYKLTWDNSVLPDSRIGCQIINQRGLDKVLNPTASFITYFDDFIDTGWIQNGQTLEIPETYNSSPLAIIRIVFKANEADSADVTSGSIGWVKIVEDTETEAKDKIRIIPKDELSYQTGVLNSPPYYSTGRPERICYWNALNLEVVPGASYYFKFEKNSSYPNAQLSVDVCNENAINAMQNGVAMDASDLTGPNGWADTGQTVVIPALINDSPSKGIKLSFRPQASTSGSFTSNDAIRWVMIRKEITE